MASRATSIPSVQVYSGDWIDGISVVYTDGHVDSMGNTAWPSPTAEYVDDPLNPIVSMWFFSDDIKYDSYDLKDYQAYLEYMTGMHACMHEDSDDFTLHILVYTGMHDDSDDFKLHIYPASFLRFFCDYVGWQSYK